MFTIHFKNIRLGSPFLGNIILLQNGTELNIPWHYFPERNNSLTVV